MRMVQRRDRPRLSFESIAELFGGNFDGYGAAKAGVQTSVNLSLAALAQQAKDLVRAKSLAGCQDGACRRQVVCLGPRDLVDQPLRAAILPQQGFHFPAQFEIMSTGFGQESILLRRLLFQDQMVKLLDLPPAFGVHGLRSG